LISKLLIESDADVNAQDNCGRSALIWSFYIDQTEIVDLLIENGAKVPLSCIFRVGLKRYLKQFSEFSVKKN